MKKRILVVVVTYNGMNWLDRCLGSIRTSNMPADVIVIDNGSKDGTCQYVPSAFPEVNFICTGENLGFGKANNIGFRYALEQEYDYVYLLNQDAWVFPDTFGVLAGAMDADDSLGILSPMQMAA
ncbi:MAG: glycosyltransferase, partial [Bacteroidales bacterium]|nr:glycosyltransferase [Bacteroidales bacterium]